MQTTGSRLGGRYRLEEVIGRGGMSTVYRATDETLGRTVAVKMLLPGLAEQDPTYSARFQREARAAAALANSSVVTVYDTGVDDESHYIVMECVDGESLEEILRQGRRFEVAEALRIAVRIADALAAAHAAGILHRDIKPANVMVTGSGAVKVLDFGIARRLDGTTITQVASVVGTAAYMAPERALGEPGDARADIYSLGCLLYAMLTGVPPFTGEIAAAVLHQQINAVPQPPSQLREGVPPALDALVLDMLAKAPAERPASALAVRDRLLEVSGEAPPAAAGTGITAATAPLTAATTPLNAAPPAMAVARSRFRALLADHRSRAVLMALLTGVITLIAVALLSGGGSSRSRTNPPPSPTATSTPPATTHAPTTPSTQAPTTETTPPAPKPKPKDKQKPPKQPGDVKPPGHGDEPPGQAKKH